MPCILGDQDQELLSDAAVSSGASGKNALTDSCFSVRYWTGWSG